MATGPLAKGTVDFYRQQRLGGLFVLVEPTENPRKVYIRISTEPLPKVKKVRHWKPRAREEREDG